MSANSTIPQVLINDADGDGPVGVVPGGGVATAGMPSLVVMLHPNQPALPVTTSPLTALSGLAFGDVVLTSATTSPIRRTVYTEQAANFTGSIVSANAQDNAAGTGARTVRIYWMNAAGTLTGTEDVTLNGITPVNLVNANKCFIEKMKVLTAGTGGVAAGIISLRAGAAGAGATIGTIAAGDRQTFWAHHYIEMGKTCNVTGAYHGNTSTVSGGTSTAILTARWIGLANAVEEQVSDFLSVGGASNPITRPYGSVIRVDGPARVMMYVTSSSAASVTYRGSFDFYDA